MVGPTGAACAAMLVATSLLFPAAAPAADNAPLPAKVSFDEATSRLRTVSSAIAAAQAAQQSSEDRADALKSLNLPTVSLEVDAFRYYKSFESSDLPEIDNTRLNGQPLPPALGGLIGALPSVSFNYTEDVLRPVANAVLPIYTGGKITSAQEGARALARQAAAVADGAANAEQVKLVSLYFGQVLAQQLNEVRCQVRDGLEHHLKNARALEREGVATKAERMQVEVARDAAERGCAQSARTLEAARVALANLLRADRPLALSTPLFLSTAPVDPRARFVDKAMMSNPQLRGLDAATDAASQAVRAERSRWKPNVFAFASYNLRQSKQLLVDPDWVVGLGLRWELFSSIDRRKSISAANHKLEAVSSAKDEARMQLSTAVVAIYESLVGAQEQYRLLQSTEDLARENVRIQGLAFSEGQGTAVSMIDAENALAAARVERAVAAYNFDVALARLLDATGDMDRFNAMMTAADVHLAGDAL